MNPADLTSKHLGIRVSATYREGPATVTVEGRLDGFAHRGDRTYSWDGSTVRMLIHTTVVIEGHECTPETLEAR